MQTCTRRSVTFFCKFARNCSTSTGPSPLSDVPGTSGSQSKERGSLPVATEQGDAVTGANGKKPAFLVRQNVQLVEQSVNIESGVLRWTAKHACSEEDDINPPKQPKSLFERLSSKIAWAKRYIHSHCVDQCRALLLPTGYPHAVKENYDHYITSAAIQNVIANTNTVLANSFVLYAVGLSAGAIPVAGALNWVIKDGFGNVGTLIFGRVIAHDFDMNTRTWNFMSVVTINIAVAVEISLMWFPNYFLQVGAFANMLKGLGFMAGGATRAAFTVSFAKGDNVADLTAKTTSQFICSQIAGTATGIMVCCVVGEDPAMAMAASLVLSAANLMTTWTTIRSVPLSTLNHTRLQLLIDQYISLNLHGHQVSVVPLSKPFQLCLVDPVLYMPSISLDHRFRPTIDVGAPLASLLKPGLPNAGPRLRRTVEIMQQRKHLLLRTCAARGSPLHIILHESADPGHTIEAVLHAVLLRKAIKHHELESLPLPDELAMLEATAKSAARHAHCLQESLRLAQWNLERVCVENRISRALW